MDLPSLDPPTGGHSHFTEPPLGQTPTDLPPPGKGPRMALPSPDPGSSNGGHASEPSGLAQRISADFRSVVELLRWAVTAYLGTPKPFFLLAAFIIVPASLLQSCALAGLAPGAPDFGFSPGTVSVDFSAQKARLAARIQESTQRGQLDKQAVAELAALAQVESARPSMSGGPVRDGFAWLRDKLALLVQGLVLFGLAIPVACGVLAVATMDRQSGGALPALVDIWPILTSRSEHLLVSLVPAALLVALGNVLFVLPGLVLSVLFMFVPHAVIFEKRAGRSALGRSIELVRDDAIRVALVFLTFALANAVLALVMEIILPTSGSRAVVFLHHLIGDLGGAALLPVPSMMLARLYIDLRARSGAGPEKLARAARS